MIVQIIEKIKSGTPIEDAIPEGADVVFWQKLVDNYNPDKAPAKRRSPRRRAGSSSRKVNHAAAVVGRAMAELVERVNGQAVDPIIATIEARDFWAYQHQSGRVSYKDKVVA